MRKYLYLLFFVCAFVSCSSTALAEGTEGETSYLGEQFAEISFYDSNAGGTRTYTYYKGRKSEEAYKDYTVYPVLTNNKDYNQWNGDSDQCVNFFITVDSSCKDNYIYVTRKETFVKDDTDKEDVKYYENRYNVYDYRENIWTNYSTYYPDYLKQFMEEEDKDYSKFCADFSEYIKGQDLRFTISPCAYDSGSDYMKNFEQTYSGSIIVIYPEGDYVESLRSKGEKVISSQVKNSFGESYYSSSIRDLCIPFLYRKDLITKPDSSNFPAENAKDFVCYRQHIKPVASLSNTRVGSSIFTWKVEDYPEFADCYMEIRSTLLEGNQQFGYKLLTNDYYYYSSLDGSNKKPTQIRPLLKIPFAQGSTTCAESAMYDYFKTVEKFKNIAISCPIRFQVRVVSQDKTIYSNWVTFDFGVDGQNGWTGTMSDDGEVITDGINNLPDYDWDSDNNPSKYEYGADYIFGSGNENDFANWLKNALGTIISFPTLLAICYSWLPPGIINLIAISLGLLVTLRILGR